MSADGGSEQAVLAVKQHRQHQALPPRSGATCATGERTCDRCGKAHRLRNCPAFNVECRKCGKRNHFAVVCRSAADIAAGDTESMGVDALFIGAITQAQAGNILGRQACVQLNLVKKIHTAAQRDPPRTKEELLQRYASVFKGLGQFPGEHQIHVDPKVPPVVHGCRKIPFAVWDRLKETLDIQEQRSVCRKVTKPTPWVSSLVITEKKNGTLRVCLDPRDLNRA